ncbi:zn 2cys6 transcription factor [Colletotrichum truncatum]|uniref:Zn 2cys6 transcription factor n=1 Tax=Colletotrichum truncatum TaxID=5467 RepID=A0ACC3YUY1_COLTU|nr:zn 2cys6 transcription factor [Colletotrichum truncatum]KAF6782123.1 zn 2cys6 transcription factor [Colletotrichum truncatum]
MDEDATGPSGWSEEPISPVSTRQRAGVSVMTGPGRKKGTACARCRSQKIRCDDERPSCTNCARSGHPCVRANFANNPDAVNHVTKLEARLRSLEDSLRRVAPDELEKAPEVESRTTIAPSITVSTAPEPMYDPDPVIESAQPWPMQQPLPTPVDHPSHLEHEVYDGHELVVNTEDVPGLDTGQNHTTLEGASHETQDVEAENVPTVRSSTTENTTSLSPSASTEIGPSEPLAHEVGMLSLANSKESKYLGPSSGVPFARLIFSAIPQSQGLSVNWAAPEGGTVARKASPAHHPFPPHWTSEVDLQHFADAYFQTLHPLYPFLDEDSILENLEYLYTTKKAGSMQMPPLEEVEASLSPFHSVQVFLVLALGARILESRLSVEFSSERYLATAMQRIGTLALHDSIEGLQVMLLLALTSFYFEDGPNAWFLVMNIIASCLDLGFQRRGVDNHRVSPLAKAGNSHLRINLRRGIFWSAYSLERSLAVVLGRPLTLRDEAIDIEFPGCAGRSGERAEDLSGSHALTPESARSPYNPTKRARVMVNPYAAAQYSFKFDQITAEIKLMIYRVVNLPNRFPWPTDFETWQPDVQKRCDALLEGLRAEFRRGFRRSTSDGVIQSLELKYHHCIMLLYRPSPAITRPSFNSWKICYESAVATILINSELHRFFKLSNSWLTAHTVFVSGITFLYCLWVVPKIKQDTSLAAFNSNAGACVKLLKYLAKTWSVAADAVVKLERLVHLTSESWKSTTNRPPSAEVAAGHSLLSMAQGQEVDGNEVVAAPVTDMGLYTISDDNAGIGGEFEADSFFNELGDMSSWFDLNWLLDASAGLSSSEDPGSIMF